MINNENLLKMYENVFEAERQAYKTIPEAKCLADFEKADPKIYKFLLDIGTIRYEIYEYLKTRGLK